MNKKVRLKFYYFIYLLLIFLIFIIVIKFVHDFYYLDKKNNLISSKEYNTTDDLKFIINPRIQSNKNGFSYVTAENGYLDYDNDKYIFNNVEMTSSFGHMISKKLEVTDDKNIFKFTGNPKFTIYLNNIK